MPSNVVDTRVHVVAARQHGVITYAQCLAAGLSADQVEGRAERGLLHRVVRGVYRLAGSPDSWQQRAMAAQLAVGATGGVVSHTTAAALHGLCPPSRLPHVTVPPGASPRSPIAKLHRARLDAVDCATVLGIRATSASRTLVDMAGVLDRPGLETLVDAALCRNLATADSVAAALSRVGGHRRGRVLVRAVLGVWTESIAPESPAEARLLRALSAWGLPIPVTQHEVRSATGAFVARLDMAWPARLVALEYEGREFHGPRRTDADERRYATLRSLGWTVVPATKVDLLPGERRLPDLLGPLLTTRVIPLRARQTVVEAG